MASLGASYSLTANLSPEVEAEARQQEKPLDWLHRRIARRLKQVIREPVPFWLVAEEAEKRRLHLHGEIVLASRHKKVLKKVRKAIRVACGEWKVARQHQVQLRPDPDHGWAGYAGKNLWKTTKFLRGLLKGSPTAVTFDQSALTSTADVIRLASELYGRDRWRLLKAQRSGSSKRSINTDLHTEKISQY